MAMCQSVQSSNFMPDHVSSPVLRHSHSNKSIQCHCSRKHKISHQLIIMLVFTNFRSNLHQSLQNTFRPTVHNATLSGSSHILLHHMNIGISQSTSYLMRRQSKGNFRIKNREDWIVGIKRIFLFRFTTGNNCSVIHFRTGSRQSQYSGKRYSMSYRASGKY